MERFRKKQPVDYEDPYVDMLTDIDKSISTYTSIRNRIPNYVLVNTTDYERLQQAYHAAGVIPSSAQLHIIQSARVISTPDFEPGTYDVTGN